MVSILTGCVIRCLPVPSYNYDSTIVDQRNLSMGVGDGEAILDLTALSFASVRLTESLSGSLHAP